MLFLCEKIFVTLYKFWRRFLCTVTKNNFCGEKFRKPLYIRAGDVYNINYKQDYGSETFVADLKIKDGVFPLMCMIPTEEEKNTAEKIWEEHRPRMYAAAFSVLKNREDSEDAVMDAMSRIIGNIDRFAELDGNSIAALVTAYTRNTAIDIYKRNRRGTSEDLDGCFDISDGNADVEGLILISDRIDRLYGFLKTLPYIYSQTFMLKYYFGYSDAEISAAMKADRNTVRKRLTRVKKKLIENAVTAGFADEEFIRERMGEPDADGKRL